MGKFDAKNFFLKFYLNKNFNFFEEITWLRGKGRILMCLAVPAKVLEVKGEHAKVDFGGGIVREVNVSLVDVNVGET